MEQATLDKITHTVEGYPVKTLKYKKVDNIITGQVKDPEFGNPDLFDGYITCTWTIKGFITRNFKEKKGNIERPDLTLSI